MRRRTEDPRRRSGKPARVVGEVDAGGLRELAPQERHHRRALRWGEPSPASPPAPARPGRRRARRCAWTSTTTASPPSCAGCRRAWSPSAPTGWTKRSTCGRTRRYRLAGVRSYFVAANTYGGETELGHAPVEFCGFSTILGPDGRTLARAPQAGDAVILAELPPLA